MASNEKINNEVSGTRPEGARDEHDAANRVQEMFAQIAPRYDFLNHFLSCSLDHVWRARAARIFRNILRQPDARILDLCCGTGDLAFALDRERARLLGSARRKNAAIAGCDFVLPMLTRAREKAASGKRSVTFLACDALHLPFADSSFDLVTSAFGFRNLANYEAGLREVARVLKPGGEVGILEFSEPSGGVMAAAFRFYFQQILPRVGGAISGSRNAYSYLPASVAKFPSPKELALLMETCGFADATFDAWNFGSVVLHRARK